MPYPHLIQLESRQRALRERLRMLEVRDALLRSAEPPRMSRGERVLRTLGLDRTRPAADDATGQG